MPDDTITLRAIERGESTRTFNRAEYERAKADGRLDHLLDAWLSNMGTETVVTEPDGTEINPYE